MQAKCSRGAVCWGVHETPNPPPALRPLCSCRCFGCRHCCLQPLAFCCYPEPCCPWLQEVPRPSPRRPRAPPMSPARSLRPLSPAPTRRSPRRSPGGDFSVKRGKVLMKGEMGERLPVLPACLWAASAGGAALGKMQRGQKDKPLATPHPAKERAPMIPASRPLQSVTPMDGATSLDKHG